MKQCYVVLGATALACIGGVARAQTVVNTSAPASRVLPDSASPFVPVVVGNDAAAAVKMPKLEVSAAPEDAKDFDKYYYFRRAGTDFSTALADLRECDSYARGLSSGVGYAETPYPYAGTMAGVAGGAIANLMVAAIFGSAEKRRMRRINMRQCMNFKGYQRYGLAKSLWEPFNFEEGIGHVAADKREVYLRQQALVASTTPSATERDLGL